MTSLSLSPSFSVAPLRKAKFVESPRIPESELGSPTLSSAQKLDVDAYCPGKLHAKALPSKRENRQFQPEVWLNMVGLPLLDGWLDLPQSSFIDLGT